MYGSLITESAGFTFSWDFPAPPPPPHHRSVAPQGAAWLLQGGRRHVQGAALWVRLRAADNIWCIWRVGSVVVGETDGDVVGSEVVGEIVGEMVGSWIAR